MHLKQFLQPFASRNYRLFFGGQIISLTGTMMTQTATLWLAYKLTNSALLLGTMAFAGQIPSLLLGPIAGVYIDRVNRMRLLFALQVWAMVQSLIMAGLMLGGWMNVWLLAGLWAAQGMINAIDMPTRQSLIFRLIDRREHMANVIGVNATMVHLARLAGPALAGLVIAWIGAGWCFLLDGLSYLVVLGALASMRLQLPAPSRERKHPWHELREGISYAYHFRPIRALLLHLGTTSFCISAFGTFAPILAHDFYHGDAQMLGWVMSVAGVGSLFAALNLALRHSIRGLGRIIGLGSLSMGLGLLMLAWPRSLPLAIPCLLAVGAGGVLVMASSNTLLQSMLEENKRGRVMSLFTMSFAGMIPVGSLVWGALANRIGVAATMTLSGTVCLAASIWFHLYLPRFRQAAGQVIRQLHPQLLPALPAQTAETVQTA
jgi:MFS family permease